jgi:hypothetical protein
MKTIKAMLSAEVEILNFKKCLLDFTKKGFNVLKPNPKFVQSYNKGLSELHPDFTWVDLLLKHLSKTSFDFRDHQYCIKEYEFDKKSAEDSIDVNVEEDDSTLEMFDALKTMCYALDDLSHGKSEQFFELLKKANAVIGDFLKLYNYYSALDEQYEVLLANLNYAFAHQS